MNSPRAFALLSLVLATASPAGAQTLVQRSFDLLLEGDDPTESFTFTLPMSTSIPSVVQFDGFFQNLDPLETGVRYGLSWPLADGSGSGGPGDLHFMRLPASGQLPLQFEEPISFTPSAVFFTVEGGGPSDHFRFIGEFSIRQVPEPGAFTLLVTAGMIGGMRRRKS